MFKKKLLSAVLLILCILSYYNHDSTPSTEIASAGSTHSPLKLSTGLTQWFFSPH